MDVARLQRIPVFGELSTEELRTIAAYAIEVSAAEGDVLISEGDFSSQFMAIEEGTAKVVRGDEHLADLKAGDLIGEAGVLDRSKRNATVIATSPVVLVTFTHWDLKRIQKNLPGAFDKIRGVQEERAR
jgi:CRP-like cAMP-binding protein